MNKLLKNDLKRLKNHVDMLSDKCHPRNYRNISNLTKVRDYIVNEFTEAGGDVTLQPFTINNPAEYNLEPPDQCFHNVICVFGKGKGNKLIIGAHYDSFEDTPGADDNASGIAGLIELAYLISRQSPDREIELVAYSLEEPPFFRTNEMGSYRHAERTSESDVKPAGVIVLDMIGYFSDEINSQAYPLPILEKTYPSQGNFIAIVGNQQQKEFTARVKQVMKTNTDLSILAIVGPESLNGIDLSDHHNYWKFDINAVMITDTAFYRNQEYHKLGDTSDRLDYSKMRSVVNAVFELAGGL